MNARHSKLRPSPAVINMTADDWAGLAWLCDRAARGCLELNESRWASQLFLEAATLRERVDMMRAAGA